MCNEALTPLPAFPLRRCAAEGGAAERAALGAHGAPVPAELACVPFIPPAQQRACQQSVLHWAALTAHRIRGCTLVTVHGNTESRSPPPLHAGCAAEGGAAERAALGAHGAPVPAEAADGALRAVHHAALPRGALQQAHPGRTQPRVPAAHLQVRPSTPQRTHLRCHGSLTLYHTSPVEVCPAMLRAQQLQVSPLCCMLTT